MKSEQMLKDSNLQSKSVPPPIPAFSWMGSMSPLLLVPVAVVVVVALFASDGVLDQWPLARTFTNWMQLKLPFINRHASSTSYPQVALLVNCLTVALIPVLSLVWLTQSFVNYPRLLARNRAIKQLGLMKHLLIIFIAVPFFAAALYFMVALPGDPSWAKGFTTESRGGLAFLCSIMLYICSMAVGAWPLMVRLFIDLHIKKGVEINLDYSN
ncbi:MAG: hypothetical protein C0428_13775 [Polaromonas sp.]|nr:hypothetical protein [Polaromonas sp.]